MVNALKRLSWPVRVLILVAALMPLATFAYPLWHYDFDAPQYPEGLSMTIWTYQLGGRIDLINALNHYVGFMALHEEDFVEFKVLPAAVVLLTLTGIAAAAIGTFRALFIWLAGYGVFGVIAFADFYRWLYTFANTIDPRAAITVEGYQPPMFGTSEFLNFYITSYPGVGFYVFVASAMMGALAFGLAFLQRPPGAVAARSTHARANHRSTRRNLRPLR
jgi:copper chaperone NosL